MPLKWVYQDVAGPKNEQLPASGRASFKGHYCQFNHILIDILGSITISFDYVAIDGGAVIEHVNRNAMKSVTHLALVSDGSQKGLRVAATLRQVADAAIDFRKVGLIVIRLRNEAERSALSIPVGLDCLGWIPEDNTIWTTDLQGCSFLDLSPDYPAEASVRNFLNTFLE